jgi:hypothetical protein
MRATTKANFIAVALFTAPMASYSQVTFEQVEAALVALESAAAQITGQNAAQTPEGGGTTATVARLPLADTGSVGGALLTTPPPFTPGAIPQTPSPTEGGTTFDFRPVDIEVSCEGGLSAVADEAQTLTKYTDSTQSVLLALDSRFLEVEEGYDAIRADFDLTQCPARYLNEVQDLLEGLTRFDTSDAVHRGETLSICIERERQRLDGQIEVLQASTNRDEQARANEQLNVKNRWTLHGESVVAAVQTLISLGARNQRLTRAVEQMRDYCSTLDREP